MTEQKRREAFARGLDELDLDGLEDFESEDLDKDAAEDDDEADDRGRNAAVAGLWERWGFDGREGQDRDRAIVTAHKMVQSFVDTFATDGHYRVTFDPSISTAGTDLEGHKVVITPAPLFDETITTAQAAVLLTAMATHEVCHPRYGRSTAVAVRRTFGNKRAPNALSNVLDDVRIERRFAADFPGYADVFRPMLDYIGKADAKRYPRPQSMTDLVNLCIAAVRYERWATWPASTVDEREWWKAWAERWSREDAPRRHVEGVREGLRHILLNQVKRKKRAKDASVDPKVLVTADVARIQGSLAGLDPLAQKAIRLRSEGRKPQEIAAVLGVSIAKTKEALRRGRRTLAEAAS